MEGDAKRRITYQVRFFPKSLATNDLKVSHFQKHLYKFKQYYSHHMFCKKMSKNKGLTPKRKKIDRNPRVKHRESSDDVLLKPVPVL